MESLTMLYGDTIICEYTNWRGKTSTRGFVYLESFFGKNEYHREEQLLHVGYDIIKREVRTFSDSGINGKSLQLIKPYINRSVTCRTNWYEIVNDEARFHHQTPFKDINPLSPTINDNRYGLQSKWSKSLWEKCNLYYIDGVYVGRAKVC